MAKAAQQLDLSKKKQRSVSKHGKLPFLHWKYGPEVSKSQGAALDQSRHKADVCYLRKP
jgi:hypothetical protein